MGKRPLSAQDLYRITSVGDPQVAPDGQRVAFVRQTLDPSKKKPLTSIWIADCDSGQMVQLTRGDSDRHPRWAPDSRRIAFLSGRAGSGDLYIIDTRGGEAQPLKLELNPETPPLWSPDGTRIAFVARQLAKESSWEPYEGCPDYDRDRAQRAAGESMKSRDEKRDEDPLLEVKVITETRFRFDGMGFFGDLKRQVFLVDVPGEAGDEPAKPCRVSSLDVDHVHLGFSPDGRFLAFSAFRPGARGQDLAYMDLWRVELSTGLSQKLLSSRGPVSGLSWSPDGRHLACVGHHSEKGLSTSPYLYLVPLSGDQEFPLDPPEVTCLTPALDRPVGVTISSDVRYGVDTCTPIWSEDSQEIYFLVGDRGTAGIFRIQRSGEGEFLEPQAVLLDENRSIASLSLGGGNLAFQACSAHRPDEIFLVDPGGQEKQLTQENSFLEDVSLSEALPLSYPGANGLEIQAWLYRDPRASEGAMPLILMIHGGPHGVYGQSFNFLTQYLVSRGFMVLMANPRGSQTYGQDFASRVVGEWGGKDFEDLMAGVDEIISRGLADPDRLGVTGWSYGGFMTNWIIGSTRRFKAAVSGACVFNNLDFYGTSDIGLFFGEFQWQGNPWDNPDRLLRLSPMKNAAKIETPVLLLHGESDLRCPLSQSEQIYAALKRQGKKAVLVTYPGQYHSLSTPAHRFDRCQRTADWFAHYLLDREPVERRR